MAVTLVTNTGLNKRSARPVFDSAGTVWVAVLIASTEDEVQMWEGSLGGSFTKRDTITATTLMGSNLYGILNIAAAIDSNDIIHVAASTNADGNTRDIAYVQFDTSPKTFGSAEDLHTDSGLSVQRRVDITVNGSDVPEAAFMMRVAHHGTGYRGVGYAARTGGTWDTAEQVNNVDNQNHSGIGIARVGSTGAQVLVTYLDGDSPFNGLYRVRNGSWGTEISEVSNGNDVGHSPMSTSTGTYYRLHSDTSQNIYVNGTDEGDNKDTGTYRFSGAVDSSDNAYYFFIENGDLKYSKNSGSGWGAPVTLETGSYDTCHVFSQYFSQNENDSQLLISVANELATGVWVTSLDVSAAGPRRVFVTHV